MENLTFYFRKISDISYLRNNYATESVARAIRCYALPKTSHIIKELNRFQNVYSNNIAKIFSKIIKFSN